jgi:hypothetical protein
MRWSRDNYHEVQVSTYKQGRINSPLWSTKLLKYFKLQNRHIWDKISVIFLIGFFLKLLLFRALKQARNIIGVR